ncbi:MAG: hypothetical protein JWM68_1501 [Verrucomicrobiales bacterium]|nr:hypothetical protein [Verrucomicrobiales bacterium]
MNDVITLRGISNEEFFLKHAAPGRIGLTGGATLVDRAIRRAERHVCDGKWSSWSHAFIFGEKRSDGHIWVIESDLQAARKHIRLGVQENRLNKYFDEKMYGMAAILDFRLPPEKTSALITAGLDMVSNATRYSIRELFGTLIALRAQTLRSEENRLSREKSFYCSALVQHLFNSIALDLTPGIHAKHTTPEDIFQTAIPHTRYVLHRELGESKIKEAAQRMRAKLKAGIRRPRTEK